MMWRERVAQRRKRSGTARASWSTVRAKMLRRVRVCQRHEQKCYGASELVNGASKNVTACASLSTAQEKVARRERVSQWRA